MNRKDAFSASISSINIERCGKNKNVLRFWNTKLLLEVRFQIAVSDKKWGVMGVDSLKQKNSKKILWKPGWNHVFSINES